jgi:saccharopine dehydrogenase (NAD+, L-lysine-forming)
VRTLLLGVGSVGAVIARHLVGDNRISLSMIDSDGERLKIVKGKLKERRVGTYVMDISDESRLEEVLKEHDLLINAATPSLNSYLMNLCLKHGLHYIDLASDDVEQQLRWNSRWLRKELKALICLGEDPGLSNIYAKYSAERLKKVVAIKVRDGEFSSGGRYGMVALFSPRVFFKELFSPPFIFIDGRHRRLPPLSSREIYDFPGPIRSRVVYALNHEEVFTLPRYFRSVRYVDFKLSLSEEFVNTVRMLKRLGILRTGKINVGGSRVSPLDVFLSLIPRPYDVSGKIAGYAGIAVEVSGYEKDMLKTMTVYTFMSHGEAYHLFGTNATAYLTGTVPAVVASMVARDKVDENGVITPEELDAGAIIRSIGEKKIRTYVKTAEEGSIAVTS